METELFLLLLSLTVARAKISRVDTWQLQDLTLPSDLHLFICDNLSGVTETCGELLNVMCQNETLLDTMFDAWSKFPYSGLKYSSRIDLGNYDQCMSIDHKYEGGRILGEYCIGLILPDIFGNISDTSSFYSLAVCRPKGCTANDFNTILNNIIENFPFPVFQDVSCRTIETGKEYTAGDIITILIISLCILLMVISSIYDFYLYKMQLDSPNPLYIAFSVISNGKKLFHIAKNSKEQIPSFQGIRVISMMWIVAGHGMSIWDYLPVTNLPDVAAWKTKMSALYITTAPLAVDSFFFMSGFLLAYQYLKQKPKPLKAHITSIPLLYVHRYIRLTPVLLMAFLVSISLFKHLGHGPVWSQATETLSAPCRKYWWSFFLYIQNYYNYEDPCLVTTWYLSADMQMFLLAPLVLIPVALQLKRLSAFKWVMVQLLGLNVFCTFLPMVTKLVFRDYDNGYETHSRFIDYFIGVMLGVFMRIKQDKPFLYMINSHRKSLINLLTWIVILLGMLAVIISFRELELHSGDVNNIVFACLMKPAWCIGLSWIAYSCYHGYGGIVNWVLGRPIFQAWGRFTYSMFILHFIVVMYYVGNLRAKSYFSDYIIFYLFCGHYVVTAILSVFWTLSFESPLIILEKVLLGGRNRGNKEDKVKPKNGTSEGGPKYATEVP